MYKCTIISSKRMKEQNTCGFVINNSVSYKNPV
jgi:hypothetical protein